ncbi:MAG: hypothetical protein ACYC5H_07955 [Methylovirgula sp.]
MSAWTPADKDQHPLQAAIHDLARHYLMPTIVRAPAPRGPEGWHSLVLSDGQRATIFLEIAARAEIKFGPRAALAYDIKGRATLEDNGFAFTGDVVVDRATRAFLQVDSRLQALGRIT